MTAAAGQAEHGPSLTTRAAVASVCAALVLLALKIYAALETGSVAMLGSLADTGLDLVASVSTDRDRARGHRIATHQICSGRNSTSPVSRA